jgi:hypothetical protein
MLWSSSKQFLEEPFEKEDELEKAVKAPQAPRYTSFERLMKAKSLDEAF